jgi:hypothetical protein
MEPLKRNQRKVIYESQRLQISKEALNQRTKAILSPNKNQKAADNSLEIIQMQESTQ